MTTREFGLNWAQERVRKFHEAAGQPIGVHPSQLTGERKSIRAAWMAEELDEYNQSQSLVDEVDALLDLEYFVLGTLVEMGVDSEHLFDIVHRANMAKVAHGRTLARLEDGKIQKPAAWVSPETQLAQALTKSRSGLTTFEPVDAQRSLIAATEIIQVALGGERLKNKPIEQYDFHSYILKPGPLDDWLKEVGSALRDRFLPVNEIGEDIFAAILTQSLGTDVAVLMPAVSGAMYRSDDATPHYVIVFSVGAKYAEVFDPVNSTYGYQSVQLDDLFAGLRKTGDGLHLLHSVQES